LLDFSQKSELRLLGALVKAVDAAAAGLPFLIAGAMARDLLLVHAHDIPSQRATEDVDLACFVQDWGEFEALRNELLSGGEFAEVPRKGIHALRFRRSLEVDILPFGGVERDDRTVVLPPDNAFEISMFGFREALDSSVTVLLPDDAKVQVVSLPALAVLKLSAWTERRLRAPGRDAYDLLFVIRNYSYAEQYGHLHDQNPYLTDSPADFEAGGAWLLGRDMASLVDTAGHERLATIIANETDPTGQLHLAGEMMRDNLERALELLKALEDGFIGGAPDRKDLGR
jgi:predicted nucleotidyltransferase